MPFFSPYFSILHHIIPLFIYFYPILFIYLFII
jgi:hypothetical protein